MVRGNTRRLADGRCGRTNGAPPSATRCRSERTRNAALPPLLRLDAAHRLHTMESGVEARTDTKDTDLFFFPPCFDLRGGMM